MALESSLKRFNREKPLLEFVKNSADRSKVNTFLEHGHGFSSMNRFRKSAAVAAGDGDLQMRRIHEAAGREVQSGNLVPFESRQFLVSLWLRLLLRTSRTAGLLRLGAAGADFPYFQQ